MRMYVELFVLGATLGAGPCLAVCAPILIPFIASTGQNWRQGLKAAAVFSFFRALAYAALGVVSVLCYALIESIVVPENRYYLSLLAGFFVVAVGLLFILMKRDIHLPFFGSLADRLLRKSNQSMAVLGLLIGFSPCLPLIGALALVAAQATSVLDGAALGLTFGMGTFLSPLLVLAVLAGHVSERMSKSRRLFGTLRMVCGIVLVVSGLYLIRG